MSYSGGPGLANRDTLCNKEYAVAYSGVHNTFNNVPTYSWTVFVMARGLGYNLSAENSHACIWGPEKN